MSENGVSRDLHALRARIAEILGDHGLELRWFGITVEDSDVLDAQLLVSPGDEGPHADDGFDEVILGAQRAEIEEQARRRRAELEARLQKHLDDGALWDDE